MMHLATRRLLVAVVLALVWVPAFYLAWGLCPKFKQMFMEFEIQADPLTFLLLKHDGWLCPMAALITIALATWRPATSLVAISVVMALAFVGLPLCLSLFHLSELVWQLS